MKHLKPLVLIVLLCTLLSCSDWSGTPDNEINPVTVINEITVTPDTAAIGELIKLEVSYRDQNNPNFSVYWAPISETVGHFVNFKREKPSYLVPINEVFDSAAVFFDTNYFLDTTLSGIELHTLSVYVADTTLANAIESSSSRDFIIFVNH